MERQSEDEDRALDAQCAGSRRSGPFRASVSKLKALLPPGQMLCIVNYAYRNLPHLLRCALAAGISADMRCCAGDDITPVLCIAAQFGNEHALEALLVGRANVALADRMGRTAAHWAAHNGHAPCLRLLLNAGAPKEAKEELGLTPLHVAACGGRAECCSLLLSSGCCVDPLSKTQATPLYYAARMGHVDVLQMLLDAGANPNTADNAGDTPLINAVIARGAAPFLDLSITNQMGQNALHIAITFENMECFEVLLPLVSDVDVRTVQSVTKDGSPCLTYDLTPLHLSCLGLPAR